MPSSIETDPLTLPDGAVLRTARHGDEPGILACIRELAEFEREPDAVESTVAMLEATLFGPSPSVFAHVIEKDGAIDAIAIWFLNYSTWTGTNGIYLEDLIVRSESRGGGYGRALLRRLASIAVDRGYQRFEWSVLDWNSAAIGFYRGIGSIGMDGWHTERLQGDALRDLAAE